MTADTLTTALATSDMLIINGLHAFDFTLDRQLLIESMDGRELKRWTFSPEQLEAATFDDSLQSWVLCNDDGEHRLVCLSAIQGDNNNDEDEADDA
ncbi:MULTISPECIES: DUF5629 family protein [Pseudomonas]|jgi:hypothetical protein|uniref:DUF5629 domain-containing protein n=1 Tax=Pseudomonas orientalis TaxID=76758 RepID=A0A2L0RVF4_9PSED|nr:MULTISPECIES: DUF5629 family protein [Pseudomonas]POM09628.1 hypothetical protein CUU62_28390 [Pseudomonas sp. WP001]AUZ46083.1 hypothetical protein BOP93_10925 [Pseudomonas orientalis]MBY8931364.1 DUF5629 family protein [Pseudomonas sp. Wu6]MDO4237736.1 DUF5629 family protein [Pseudomonas sp.]RZI24385.1 hypothetical protein EUX53_11030 [Pseudomonas orientalis]